MNPLGDVPAGGVDMEPTSAQRSRIRAMVGRRGSHYPIMIMPGAAAPRLVGESWHFATRAGKYVRFPSAYRKRGWSNLVYVPSSLTIEVGEEWLKGGLK